MSEREHERGEGQREKQTPQGAGSGMWDSILEVRDHDLSRRQSLNQLSHPGTQITNIFDRLYFFRAVLGSQKNYMDCKKISHVLLPTPSCTASPTVNILLQRVTFVAIDKPILRHHYHPKSIVYIRVQSWCCMF